MTASGPALAPCRKLPPRSRAPGSPTVAAPARHWKSPVGLTSGLQAPHTVDCGSHSATHSLRLPTISKAPRDEMQLRRDPVSAAAPVLAVLQSVVPLSGPGSGVSATATCHSAFDGSRLPEFRHACCAWNQVIDADGVTPARLTAKMSWAQFCPLSAHGA